MDETTKKKWSLLMGINKYPKLPPQKQLNGCVNDVELMADTLQRTFSIPTCKRQEKSEHAELSTTDRGSTHRSIWCLSCANLFHRQRHLSCILFENDILLCISI
jgi:hypothetical protein